MQDDPELSLADVSCFPGRNPFDRLRDPPIHKFLSLRWVELVETSKRDPTSPRPSHPALRRLSKLSGQPVELSEGFLAKGTDLEVGRSEEHAAVLLRLEREDIQRFETICRHIGRVLPTFDRFQIEESYGKVLLRWKAKGTDKTFGRT